MTDERVHPCIGCEDYIPENWCKSKGGCGAPRGNEEKAKAGEWQELSKQAVICSVCGRALNEKMARQFSFCPFCGTKMSDKEAKE